MFCTERTSGEGSTDDITLVKLGDCERTYKACVELLVLRRGGVLGGAAVNARVCNNRGVRATKNGRQQGGRQRVANSCRDLRIRLSRLV